MALPSNLRMPCSYIVLPCPLPIHPPESWPAPKAFLTITAAHSHPNTSRTLAPGCQELLLKVREAKIVCALSIPLNCSHRRGGAESLVLLGVEGTKEEQSLLRSGDANLQQWQQPHLGGHLQRYTGNRLSSEHHKREISLFCNFIVLISSHLKPSISSLLSRAFLSVLGRKLE